MPGMASLEHSGEFNFPPYDTLPDITQPGWDCDPFRMIRLGESGQILYFAAVNHGSLPSRDNPHYDMVFSIFCATWLCWRPRLYAVLL